MATLLVSYSPPDDAATFDQHYHEVHIPPVRQIPDLRSLVVSGGPITSPSGADRGAPVSSTVSLRREDVLCLSEIGYASG